MDDELQEVHELPKITGKIVCVHVLEGRKRKEKTAFFHFFSRVSGDKQSSSGGGFGRQKNWGF